MYVYSQKTTAWVGHFFGISGAMTSLSTMLAQGPSFTLLMRCLPWGEHCYSSRCLSRCEMLFLIQGKSFFLQGASTFPFHSTRIGAELYTPLVVLVSGWMLLLFKVLTPSIACPSAWYCCSPKVLALLLTSDMKFFSPKGKYFPFLLCLPRGRDTPPAMLILGWTLLLFRVLTARPELWALFAIAHSSASCCCLPHCKPLLTRVPSL